MIKSYEDSLLGAFMSARSRRERNWVGATVLIAVGVIGLAANFDLVSREYLDQLWKLWPVIPLVIGLAILMRPRRAGEDQRDAGGP
jgi:cadmium resistance protein CadD (predicted permease)